MTEGEEGLGLLTRSPCRRIRKHSPISDFKKILPSNQERQLRSNCQEDRFVRQKTAHSDRLLQPFGTLKQELSVDVIKKQ
jgi:hypothetical protein